MNRKKYAQSKRAFKGGDPMGLIWSDADVQIDHPATRRPLDCGESTQPAPAALTILDCTAKPNEAPQSNDAPTESGESSESCEFVTS